jgi:hypothetical protein
MSRAEMEALHWDELDILLITGDCYVDHPSFGVAIIGRLLESKGYKVGIIAQPDWSTPDSLRVMGRPRIGIGVTSGNIDSMVNLYTVGRRLRREDAFSEDNIPGKRPPHAVTVYAQLARQAFPGVPVMLGGIEASLRRIAHYDYWQDKIRPSVLVDAKAEILVYGMGERPTPEIFDRFRDGKSLEGIRGTARLLGKKAAESFDTSNYRELPSYEETLQSKDALMTATKLVEEEMNPFRGCGLVHQPFAVLIFLQGLAEELCHALHRRIGMLLQNGLVTGKIVVIPKKQRGERARAGAGMTVCLRRAYGIERCRRAYGPAAFTLAGEPFGQVLLYVSFGVLTRTGHICCRVIAVCGEAFRKVCDVRGPIVHLNVYVVVVIAPPRSAVVCAPGSLKVGGVSAAARGGYQKVASVLENKLLKVAAFFASLIGFEQVVCGYAAVFSADRKSYSAEKLAVVVDMRCSQRVIALGASRVERFQDIVARVGVCRELFFIFTFHENAAFHAVVCSAGEENFRAFSTAHRDFAVCVCYFAAVCLNA